MTKLENSKCLRCKIPLETSWGKPLCGLCKRELDAMHEMQEYTMFRKVYYMPCTEGVSLNWLLTNGYEKEITMPHRNHKVIAKKHPVRVAHEVAMNTS